MQKLQAHSSRKFSGLAKEDNLVPVGEQCFRTSKLFWRTNTTVEIRLYYCKELDILTMQIYDETNHKEMSPLYICRSRCEANLQNDEEQVTTGTSGTSTTSTPTTETGTATMAVPDELMGKYLVARLKLRHSSQAITEDLDQSTAATATDTGEAAEYIPFLCKLSGDDWNESLVLPKPANLASPPAINETKASDAEKAFEQAVRGLKTATRRARTSRHSAEKFEGVLSDVLAEIQEDL